MINTSYQYDEKYLVIGGKDGEIKVYDIFTQ